MSNVDQPPPALEERMERFYAQLVNGVRTARAGTLVGEVRALEAVLADFEKVLFTKDSGHVCPVRDEEGFRCRLPIDHDIEHLFHLSTLRRVYLSGWNEAKPFVARTWLAEDGPPDVEWNSEDTSYYVGAPESED